MMWLLPRSTINQCRIINYYLDLMEDSCLSRNSYTRGFMGTGMRLSCCTLSQSHAESRLRGSRDTNLLPHILGADWLMVKYVIEQKLSECVLPRPHSWKHIQIFYNSASALVHLRQQSRSPRCSAVGSIRLQPENALSQGSTRPSS